MIIRNSEISLFMKRMKEEFFSPWRHFSTFLGAVDSNPGRVHRLMQRTDSAAFVQSIGLGFGASFMASIVTRAGSGGKLLLPKSEGKKSRS